MPLIMFARFLASIFSWLFLAVTIYLGWSWYEGEWIQTLTGEAIRIREDWRLWLAGGFVVWSFAGGTIMPAILARPDKRRFVGSYGTGEFIDGADGARLYIETYGDKDAPPIILTHGWGMDLTIWGPLRDALAQRFQVTIWDLPGMGRSKPGATGITIEAFAANLQRVIQRTTTKRVVLIGHSIGGMTTQTLARDHPAFFETRVAGTVLLNTTYTNPLHTMILSGLVRALQKPLIEPLMHLTRWLYPLAWISGWQSYFNGSAHLANRIGFGPDVTGSQLDHTALLATRNSPGAQAEGNLAMFHWDASRALIGSRVPVLAIGGTLDIVTKPEASDTIASIAPLGQATLFERANHMGFLECASVYTQEIEGFIARLEAAEPGLPEVTVAGPGGVTLPAPSLD